MRGDDNDVLSFREKVEGEDAFDRGAMDLFRLVPFPISHRLEAAEARVSEPAFDTLLQTGVELRLGEMFEEDYGTPALLCGARDQIIQLGGGVDESELPQVVSQRRRDRVG